MNTKITVSKRDEEEFYKLLGINDDKRMYNLNGNLQRENPTISKDCSEVGSYPFIPIQLSYIMKHFIVIRKWIKKQNRYYTKATKSNKKSSFLDAGSGLGNILVAAKAAKLAKHFTGIEFNEPTHKMAKKFINNKDKDFSLLLDNILTYDNYGMFDIIYYYCPLSISILEVYFEELVEDNASVGTIIISKMKAGAQVREDKRFRKVNLSVKYHGYKGAVELPLVDFYIKVKGGKRETSDLPGILKSRGLPPGKIDKDKLALIKKQILTGEIWEKHF